MAEFSRLLPLPDISPGDTIGGEFLALYSRHAKHIYQFIRTLVSNQADAEDAFQEVSTALWQKFQAAGIPLQSPACARHALNRFLA
jgi:hypothetical protein